MMKIFIFLTIIVAVGCSSGADKKANEGIVQLNTDSLAVKPNDTTNNIEGCYLQILNWDTFTASLQQQGNLVTGRMSFDNYEKDASTGTVSGKLQDDILKLNYAFASEGMTSVMELYFKYKDGILVRGIGEMNTKADTAYFINPALIKYDGGALQKVDCQNLPDKYK
jgi:hypothetical protein